MKAKNKKENNKSALLVGIFFLISAAFFGIFVVSENHLNLEQGQADLSSLAPTSEIDKINEHLKTTTDKMEIARLKNLVENLKTANTQTGTRSKNIGKLSEEPIINFDVDPRERRLAEDLGRTNELKTIPNDPRTQMYNSVIEDRQARKLKEEERRKQALDFVANARKDGWVVRLDENFQIKSYRRVDEPEQFTEQEVDYRGYSVIPK